MHRLPLRVIFLAVAFVAAVTAVVFALAAVAPRGSSGADASESGDPGSSGAVSSDPDAPTVAFYGDSYTLGTGASDQANRWSTVISEQRGWNEFNPSTNGLGFVNNRANIPTGTPPVYTPADEVSEVIAADPDIVFITMGLNDNFSMPQRADEIKAAIATDFATLDEKLPEARIIVVEPFWYTDARPESVEQIIGWVRDEAVVIGADYLPGASRWIEGHPKWMAPDNQHPNDAGYAEMTIRMNESLASIGL